MGKVHQNSATYMRTHHFGPQRLAARQTLLQWWLWLTRRLPATKPEE
jgi:hypothetical protein